MTTEATSEEVEAAKAIGVSVAELRGRRAGIAAEIVQAIRRDIAAAPDCTRSGDCPERVHQSGCLSKWLTGTEIENATTPTDEELRGRRDASANAAG